MTRPIIIAARFFLAIILVTITAQIAWNELVDRSLYHCTDDGLGLDFIFPGSWVHSPVAVQDLHKPRSDGRDTIKEGWTVMDLWCLWSFCSASWPSLSEGDGSLCWIGIAKQAGGSGERGGTPGRL